MYDPSINSHDIINSLMTLILCELIDVSEKDMEKQDNIMKRNSIRPDPPLYRREL